MTLTPAATQDLERALADISGARASLLSVVASLTPDDLARSRRGGWTIGRVLEHVIESEQMYAKLLAHLCGRTAPDLSGPAVDDIEQVQQLLHHSRNAVLSAVDGVDEDTLYRLARVGHEEYSVLSGLENVALHDREHRDQIDDLLASQRARSAGSRASAPVTIRDAVAADLPRITDIYNHFVRTSPATFDLEPFTVEQRMEWFSHYANTGPHRLLVAESDGAICAYAGTSQFRTKPAYDTTVEVTIYCAPEATGRGVGPQLYTALFDAIRGEDLHIAIAGITLPNEASCTLHERFGFRRVGVMPQVGRKFDRYWDVAWYQRELGVKFAGT